MRRRFFFSAVFILLVLFSSFLLIGCGEAGQSKRSNSGSFISGFAGGDFGIGISLLNGAPPTVIQDRGMSPFSFIIALENRGEAPVGPGTDNPLIIARLSGIKPSEFGMAEDSLAVRLNTKLEPARRNYDNSISPGEIDHVNFENLNYKRLLTESFAMTFRAEVCYDYESYATTQICLKKDVVESAEDATICMLRGEKGVGNSGAPLHVTKVEEAPINPEKVQINFMIEHVGRGMFFYRNEPADLYDACVFDDANPNLYKLEVFVEPLQAGMYDIQCLRLDNKLQNGGASGVVRMPDGAPLSITCFVSRLKPMETRVYQDLLNIKLKYRYGEFVEQPILIQPSQ